MKTYKIESLSDLLKVPADRRDAMLADMKAWMEFHDSIGVPPELTTVRSFTWQDDGKVGMGSATLRYTDATVVVTPEGVTVTEGCTQ